MAGDDQTREIDDIIAATTFDLLKSEDQIQLSNVIDDLRAQNVGQLLPEDGLPQLIVCGDESSGKSSVLEALTRVRFTVRSNTCTTFATELRLRRQPTVRISSKIKPGAARTSIEKERVENFRGSFSAQSKFPDLINAARECMNQNTDRQSTLFDDVLQVEIVGPDLAPLTFVDLPGFIHYRDSSEMNHDINTVTTLVQSYMKQSNSIILAVIPASASINTQAVLKHISEIVPDGSRTLGIITEPDEVPRGSEKEQDLIDFARNRGFKYGWHAVQNRGYGEQEISSEERDEIERKFFEKSPCQNLPSNEVGYKIDSLRTKLGKLLVDKIHPGLSTISY